MDPPPPNPAKKKKKKYKLPDPKQMDFNPSLQNFLLAGRPVRRDRALLGAAAVLPCCPGLSNFEHLLLSVVLSRICQYVL